MEPKKTTRGSLADWVIAIGGVFLMIGLVGLFTGMLPAATMPDLETKISDTNISTIMTILSVVGLATLLVGLMMKRKK